MSDELVIGLDELSSVFKNGALVLDENEHQVTKNADGSVNILLDPDSNTIVGGGSEIDLSDSLSECIYTRLSGFGFTDLNNGDKSLLALLLKKVNETIRNLTNLDKVPDGLKYKVVEAVCADFLEMKYTMGGIKVDFASPVASISEGDTTVSFKTAKNPQETFLSILSGMRLSNSEIVRYRVMVW